MFTTIDAAEALFASTVQASDQPTKAQVLAAIMTTVGKLSRTGCACVVATEFGEHQDIAVIRMRWALNVVAVVYPTNTNTNN